MINEPVALDYLDDKNLQKAINYVNAKHFSEDVMTFDECMTKIRNSIEAFKNIVAESYENELSEEDVNFIETSISEMTNQMSRIRRLREDE